RSMPIGVPVQSPLLKAGHRPARIIMNGCQKVEVLPTVEYSECGRIHWRVSMYFLKEMCLYILDALVKVIRNFHEEMADEQPCGTATWQLSTTPSDRAR